MKTKRHFLLLALVIALVAIPTSFVFAKELGALIITGPGIKGELSLNDHDAMRNLEQAGFFDSSALVKAPEGLNPDMGYTITAHLSLDGKLIPFLQMVYYPTREGQPGYVHYIGRLDGEALSPVDEWSLLNHNADTALRDLMESNNVAIQSALIADSSHAEAPASSAAEPVTASAASPASSQSIYMVSAIIAAALLLVGVGLAIKRRTISHTTT